MEIATTVAFAAILLILAAFYLMSRISDADEQRQLMQRMAMPGEAQPEESITRRTRPKEGRWLSDLFGRINLLVKLEASMWQAGLYLRVSEVLLIVGFLFVAGAAACMALWGAVLLALPAGAALAALPLVYIFLRQPRRLKAFGQQLPDVLDLLKSALQAGHSLVRGMQLVVEEFPDPVSSEFRIVLEQNRLGVPLPHAFEDLLERVPDDSLRFLVVAIRVQSTVGSSLAEIIGHLGETIRARQRVQLQLRALTAQPKMSGMVVGALPVLVLVLFSFIQPSYVGMLFHDPAGLKILKLAIGCDLTAFLVIRRVVRVDF